MACGLGSVIVGIKAYQNNKFKSEYHDDMLELIKAGENDDAIALYLKKNGCKIKTIE